MKISNFKLNLHQVLPALAIILFAVLLRLLPHPPNIAPITAMALFGGFYLDKKYALAIPLGALFISDIFLGFHDTMVFVYGTFVLTGVIGVAMKRYRNIKTILLTTLASSMLFFIVTNFGVWLVSGMYVKDLSGLVQSYYFALPFFRNTIVGDMLYIALFVGAYELALRLFTLHKPAPKHT